MRRDAHQQDTKVYTGLREVLAHLRSQGPLDEGGRADIELFDQVLDELRPGSGSGVLRRMLTIAKRAARRAFIPPPNAMTVQARHGPISLGGGRLDGQIGRTSCRRRLSPGAG
jgi:hypothetical protein